MLPKSGLTNELEYSGTGGEAAEKKLLKKRGEELSLGTTLLETCEAFAEGGLMSWQLAQSDRTIGFSLAPVCQRTYR
jgi:hypothetical protein